MISFQPPKPKRHIDELSLSSIPQQLSLDENRTRKKPLVGKKFNFRVSKTQLKNEFQNDKQQPIETQPKAKRFAKFINCAFLQHETHDSNHIHKQGKKIDVLTPKFNDGTETWGFQINLQNKLPNIPKNENFKQTNAFFLQRKQQKYKHLQETFNTKDENSHKINNEQSTVKKNQKPVVLPSFFLKKPKIDSVKEPIAERESISRKQPEYHLKPLFQPPSLCLTFSKRDVDPKESSMQFSFSRQEAEHHTHHKHKNEQSFGNHERASHSYRISLPPASKSIRSQDTARQSVSFLRRSRAPIVHPLLKLN